MKTAKNKETACEKLGQIEKVIMLALNRMGRKCSADDLLKARQKLKDKRGGGDKSRF